MTPLVQAIQFGDISAANRIVMAPLTRDRAGPAQVAGWRRITDALHAAGGKIDVQLWHVGRISPVTLQPNGQPQVSGTARRAAGKTFTATGFEEVSEPRALRLDEPPRVVADYRHAARCAI